MKTLLNIQKAIHHPYHKNNFINTNYFDSNGITSLHIAASFSRERCNSLKEYCSHLDNIQKLLDLGAFPNMSDKHSTIPLQIASSRNHIDAVKLLMEYPNKCGYKSMKNWTNYIEGSALDIAKQNNYKTIIDYLNKLDI